MILVSSVLAIGTSACSVQHRDAVRGTTVQQKIDESISPMLRTYDSTLRIEPSKCEPILLQSRGIMGSCELTVDGVPLEIRVADAGPPDYFKVDFGGAVFFEMSKVEKLAQNILAQRVRLRATVSCGEPRVRLLQRGTFLTCPVRSVSQVRSVKMKTMENGLVIAYDPPGLRVTNPIPQSLLTLHKEGRPSTTRGTVVEAFISQGIAEAPTPHERFRVKCPTSMNLTGDKRGVCMVRIQSLNAVQRVGVWIDNTPALRMQPIDVVIDRSRVQRMAQEYLNRRLRDNNDVADALVRCKKGSIVVQDYKGTVR
jgi:hypothetical protein